MKITICSIFRCGILFIIIQYALIYSQTVRGEDSIASTAGFPTQTAVTATESSPASYLQKDITISKMLGAIGCAAHFTGSIMVLTSLFTGDGVMNWVGGGLDILGPIPSCIGATLVEDAMEGDYPAFPRHKFWSYYATGGVFCAANIGTSIVQTAVLINRGGYQFHASPIIFLILEIITYGAGEAYLGRAAVGPLLYTRKAERAIQKTHAFNFNIVPTFTFTGGKGVSFVGTF